MEAACIVERSVLVDKIRGALWGIYVADSLSMPVHWCDSESYLVLLSSMINCVANSGASYI